MGEVYRATDTNLKRPVAIKVLPAAMAADADRLARLQREAEVLASLSHPHIAAIHGLERANGLTALVMELVEGHSLAERLASGPLPTEEALSIANQVAQALRAAHDRGIVHRDLKPANIRVRPDGVVKVLDFGLAKAVEIAPVGPSQSALATVTTPARTQAGTILGTAAYMAPEQARGLPVDARADMWAFGCVLFELLTGGRAFSGEDTATTLAAVLRADPEWSLLPAELPTPVRVLLTRCLEKDRARRVVGAAAAEFVLGEARELSAGGERTSAPGLTVPPVGIGTAPALAAGARLSNAARAIALAAVGAIAGGTLVEWMGRRAAPAIQSLVRASIPTPDGVAPSFMEVSPDGRRLVAVFAREGRSQLHLRWLDGTQWEALGNTNGARMPFWSSDGRFIAYFADSHLKMVPAAGGPPTELCRDIGAAAGGTWHATGGVLFASAASNRTSLRRVRSPGAPCETVSAVDSRMWPQVPSFLPDGRHFLFVGGSPETSERGVYVASLDGLEPRRILADESSTVYAPEPDGRSGHLLFLRDGAVMAQSFDHRTLVTSGDPVAIARGASVSFSAPQVMISAANGVLAYAGITLERRLTWFDRGGQALGAAAPQADSRGVWLSSDGRRVLDTRPDQSGARALWLHDLVNGAAPRRIAPEDASPVWTPDGVLLLAMSGPAGAGLHRFDLEGGGPPERVLPLAEDQVLVPSDVSRDGRYLVYTTAGAATQADIWYLPLEGTPDASRAVRFLATPAVESQGQISPDGRWLAYFSTADTARGGGVSIRPFPAGAGVIGVGIDGAAQPRWSPDGKSLFVRLRTERDAATVLEVPVGGDGAGGLRLGSAKRLFDLVRISTSPDANVWTYAPHPDGRFLTQVDVAAPVESVSIVTNWHRALVRPALPTTGR
jgi:Tol biopolymer transport system component